MTPRIVHSRAAGLGASLVVLVVGCTGSPQSAAPANGSAEASPTSAAATATADQITTLTTAEQSLAAGTYRLSQQVVGYSYPPIVFTVPDGWLFGGAFLIREGDDNATLAVGFWVIDQVYGHPCQWKGTLFTPGPTVDDLSNALVDIPLRSATQPVDVSLGGATGKVLEWSVPAEMVVNERGDFVDCDSDTDGRHYFESWTGAGSASDRYHQGAGQVDRVWILDVGSRIVINAAWMPSSTTEERQELIDIVESIRFELDG